MSIEVIRFKINIVILFLIAVAYYGCDSQDNLASLKDQVYIKLFGGTGSEEGNDFIQLSSGTYVIVGSTTSYSENETQKDVFIVGADQNGNQLWTRRYGDQYDNIARSVALSPDNNSLVIAGETYLDNGKRDILLLKTDLSGNMLNEATFGEVDLDEFSKDIISVNSGGYLLIGNTNYSDSSKIYLLEVDEDFVEKPGRNRPDIGQKGGFFNQGVTATEFTDDLYLCFGTSTSGGANSNGQNIQEGNSNYYLFTIPENGSQVGNVQWFGTNEQQEIATTFTKVTGGYLLAGYQINGNRSIPYIVKVNNNLVYQWENTIDPGNNAVTSREPTSIIQTNDGGILLLMKSSIQPSTEIGLMKLNFTGDNVEWETAFGSQNNDITGSVIQQANDYLIMCGSIGFGEVNNQQINKMGLIKTNPLGELKPLE